VFVAAYTVLFVDINLVLVWRVMIQYMPDLPDDYTKVSKHVTI